VVIETVGNLPNSGGRLNLVESARQWLLLNLPYDRSDVALTVKLNAKDARELLLVYGNWLARMVQAVPRTVVISDTLKSNPLYSSRKAEIDAVADEIRRGDDLKKRLSRRVDFILDEETLPPSKRRDLDLFLNEWGMHHLHIRSEMDGDGFVKRDGPLMVAMFRYDKAYLVDIIEHQEWTKRALLEVLVDEFPNDDLFHELKNVVDVAVNYDETAHKKLRGSAVNTILKVRGKVILPAGGMVGSGYSILLARRIDELLENLRYLEGYIQKFLVPFQVPEGAIVGDPSFEFTFLAPKGYGVIEAGSRTLIEAWDV
jgi:hypothetical protein